MKTSKVYLLVLLSFMFFSCEKNINSKKQTPATKKQVVKKEISKENLKKIEFNIKGMTCEIGCARLIQSKLSKTNGVNFVKVSFKDSLAMVEYDSKKLDSKKIAAVVNQISDGTLYHVYNSKEVKSFSISK